MTISTGRISCPHHVYIHINKYYYMSQPFYKEGLQNKSIALLCQLNN